MPNKDKNTEIPQCVQPAVSDRMCYVVECSAGIYEDHHTWIAGIFLNAIDAEKLKLEIINKVEISKNIPCPFDEDNLEFLTDEQNDVYYKWSNENSDAEEFNSAKVVEYPLDKSCC
jgi:hypothetical protein